MSLRALRILHAIACHGSFARAGDAVGLTQSAVSLQVKALESEFGVRLFDRSKRYPILTEAGKIVLAKAQEVISLYDGIGEALSDEHSLSGRLQIGAIQTALSGPIPEALVALNRAHPRVRVHVAAGMSAELAVRVAAGELDAAITTEPVKPYPTELTWTNLYEDRFWVIAPPGNEHREVSDLLTSFPFIRFDRRAWAGRMIDRQLRVMQLAVREEMVLDSQEVIIKMVEKGLGVSIISLENDVIRRCNLTCVPFGYPQMIRQVVMLGKQDKLKSRPCSELIQSIIDIKNITYP